MKQYLIPGLLILLSCNKSLLKVGFNERDAKLPSMVELASFNGEGHSEFYYLASDYRKTYYEIIHLKYENGRKSMSTIRSGLKKGTRILDFSKNGNHLIWGEMHKNNGYTQDIIVYDIHTKKINIIKKGIHCGDADGYFNIRPRVDGDNVVWLEYDIEAEQNRIHIYNLTENQTNDSIVVPLMPDSVKLRNSIFALDFQDGILVHDEKKSESEYLICGYNVEKREYLFKELMPEGAFLSFSIAYDPRLHMAALYCLINKNEQIGILDIDKKQYKKLKLLKPYEAVYHDKLLYEKGLIAYTQQLNVSGRVYDHYYGTFINPMNGMECKYKAKIDIDINGDYIAFTSFNKNMTLKIEIDKFEDVLTRLQ